VRSNERWPDEGDLTLFADWAPAAATPQQPSAAIFSLIKQALTITDVWITVQRSSPSGYTRAIVRFRGSAEAQPWKKDTPKATDLPEVESSFDQQKRDGLSDELKDGFRYILALALNMKERTEWKVKYWKLRST
jgi:hypothetical protein